MVTVLGRLTAAELLAVVRACEPLHLSAMMGRYFRSFLVCYFGAAGAKFRSLLDDELRALYATVRHLHSLTN